MRMSSGHLDAEAAFQRDSGNKLQPHRGRLFPDPIPRGDKGLHDLAPQKLVASTGLHRFQSKESSGRWAGNFPSVLPRRTDRDARGEGEVPREGVAACSEKAIHDSDRPVALIQVNLSPMDDRIREAG